MLILFSSNVIIYLETQKEKSAILHPDYHFKGKVHRSYKELHNILKLKIL